MYTVKQDFHITPNLPLFAADSLKGKLCKEKGIGKHKGKRAYFSPSFS